MRLRRALRPLGAEWFLAAVRLAHARATLARGEVGDFQAAVDRVRAKTLVFTVTAGRTGTTYLARLCGLFERVAAVHEAAPGFELVLRPAQRRPNLAREFWLRHKLPAIAARPEPIYLETSNVVCKGFLEPLLALGFVPHVILLDRSPRAVALSYLARNTVPGRTDLGLRYMVSPSDPDVLALPGWRRLSDYQLCFWAALDIERRQILYREQIAAAGGRVLQTSARALGQFPSFLRLAEALDLIGPDQDLGWLARRHAEISSQSHNPNPPRGRQPANISGLEEEVWRRVAEAAPSLRATVDGKYQGAGW